MTYNLGRIVGNALITESDGLSSEYDIQARLPHDDRLKRVEAVHCEYDFVKTLIDSDEVHAALLEHLKFQYFYVVEFGMKSLDYSLESSFKHLCHRKVLADEWLTEFKSFKYEKRTLNDYLDLVSKVFSQSDFYSRVGFATTHSPEFGESFEDWCKWHQMSEKCGNEKLRKDISKAESKWFFKSRAIREVKANWEKAEERNKLARNCLGEVYPSLFTSRKMLEELRLRELKISILKRSVDKVHDVIERNIPKDYFLAKEAVGASRLYSDIVQ